MSECVNFKISSYQIKDIFTSKLSPECSACVYRCVKARLKPLLSPKRNKNLSIMLE
jgi:hypothetical protein